MSLLHLMPPMEEASSRLTDPPLTCWCRRDWIDPCSLAIVVTEPPSHFMS